MQYIDMVEPGRCAARFRYIVLDVLMQQTLQQRVMCRRIVLGRAPATTKPGIEDLRLNNKLVALNIPEVHQQRMPAAALIVRPAGRRLRWRLIVMQHRSVTLHLGALLPLDQPTDHVQYRRFLVAPKER